jgi:adenosylcobinamide-phosphate synthase
MTAVDLLLAATLDMVMGDPRWLPHPVRGMGLAIAWCEDLVRLFCESSRSLRLAGVCLAVGLPMLVYMAASVLIEQAGAVHELLGKSVAIGLAYMTLAWRDLLDHVRAVSQELAAGSLPAARRALSMIVGRDTETLTEPEIARATVETIAESTADGVMAPLVFLTIGGAPLALAYKAINTLDSMIGHREPRYVDFGWASARLDDLANWVPARLTGWLIVLGAGLATGQWDRSITSWRVLCRDGANHPSPNSGRPEAAMAGALGVRLGGVNLYDGLPQERPVIGKATRALEPGDIGLAVRIMVVTSLLGLCLAVVSLWLA